MFACLIVVKLTVCVPRFIVVQLFNAVSKHQKSIEDKLKEVGPSERKKHKGVYIMSNSFTLFIPLYWWTQSRLVKTILFLNAMVK